MPGQVQSTSKGLSLEGDITFSNARQILALGQQLIACCKVPVIVVDLAGVRKIDNSILSVLLAWQRLTAEEEQAIRFVNLDFSIVRLLKLTGVDELISYDGCNTEL